MQPDGRYVREEGGEGTSSQEALYAYFSSRRVSLEEEPVPAPEPAEQPGKKPSFWARLRRGLRPGEKRE